MAYLKNTILNYELLSFPEMLDIEERGTIETYDVSDYSSMPISKINEYVDGCDPTMFEWYQLDNNTNLEKLALDLYGNPNYWDLFIIINRRNPLFDFPYDYDVLVDMVENKISRYQEMYGKELTGVAYDKMYEAFESKTSNNNEVYRYIKIVKPSRIANFIQDGYEQGYFK